MNKNKDRVVQVPVSPKVIGIMFQKRSRWEVKDGLPLDSKVVGARYVAEKNMLYFVVQSEEFDEVVEGHVLPEKIIELRNICPELEGVSFIDTHSSDSSAVNAL